MGFLKKNFLLILIFVLAIFLRLNNDIFILGYNFDEIAIIAVARQNFPFEIYKTIGNIDYHAPLYYFIAHPFTYLENESIYLRLLNLIISLVNIFVFYKIGTLIKNKKTGIILALILTVNHLAISTVSFVKFYCLCFLLVSFSVYYLVKILKKEKGYLKFAIANFFLILSNTLGFIFVSLEYIFLFLNKKKNCAKTLYIPVLGFLIYLPILIKQIILNNNTLISPHSSYSEFSPLAFYLFLNDYFSPLINYCCNLTTIESVSFLANFINSIKNPPLDYFGLFIFTTLSLLPVIISIYLIFEAIKNNKTIAKLNLFAIAYLAIFILLVLLEKTGFIPIYIFPVGLIFLISTGFGISYLKNKKTAYICLIYLIICQLIIPNYYPIEKRDIEKSKFYYGFDKYIKENSNKNTHFIATYGGRFLKKYYKYDNIIDFDYEKIKGNNGREFIGLLFGQEIKNKATKENLKDLIEKNILEDKYHPDFENYFKKEVLNKIKKGDKITFAFYAFDYPFLISEDSYKETLLNKKYYPHLAKTNINYSINKEIVLDSAYLGEIILSYGYKHLINLLDENLKRIKIEQYARDKKDSYIKIFEAENFEKSTLWLAQNGAYGWFFVTYQKMN